MNADYIGEALAADRNHNFGDRAKLHLATFNTLADKRLLSDDMTSISNSTGRFRGDSFFG